MNNSILTTQTITDVSGSGLAVEAAQRAALNTPGDGIAQTAAFIKSLTK